jgi:hypothetical protein
MAHLWVEPRPPSDQLSFLAVWREELLSLASRTRESKEGRSHASSTSEIQLVAHPVGLAALLGYTARLHTTTFKNP